VSNFQYQPETIAHYAKAASEAFAAGHGFQVSVDPATGEFTGMCAVPGGSAFARQVAERAERRVSTLNV